MNSKMENALASDSILKFMYDRIHKNYQKRYDELVYTYCIAVSNKK